MLQDQVVLVAQETNQHLPHIMQMDLLSFESLHASCLRLRAQRARESAWTQMMAAQGTVKGMKEMEKNWKQLADIDLRPEGAADVADFLSKYGRGI